MPFKPGKDPNRAPGRPKGAKNKSTTLAEQLEEAGFSEVEVVMAIVEIAKAAEHPKHFEALKELLDRIHAKKKQMDVALDPEKSTIRIEVLDYTKPK